MVDPGFALLTFCGLCVLLLVLLWSKVGLLARWQRSSRLRERVLLEDTLKHVFVSRQDGVVCSVDSIAGRLEISAARAARLLSRLVQIELIRMGSDGPVLTQNGNQSAVRIVRTHRLWEKYLADRTGVPASEWHEKAEKMEHALSSEETDALEMRLGYPSWDPHGDPIPDSAGEIPPSTGIGLDQVEPDCVAEVVHLEDEPREIYDGLLKDGFTLGGRIEVISCGERGIRVSASGREWTVDPVSAQNVSVRKLGKGESVEPKWRTLLDAQLGEGTRVVGISQACQGMQRRRLLDLGIVRGAEIIPEFVSASGDPVAYKIRGAIIALRSQQASLIRIERPTESQNSEVIG